MFIIIMELSVLRFQEITNYIFTTNNADKIYLLQILLEQPPKGGVNYKIEKVWESSYGHLVRVAEWYPNQFHLSNVPLRVHIQLVNLISDFKIRISYEQMCLLNEIIKK